MHVRLAVAAGLALIATVLAVVLLQSTEQSLGSNSSVRASGAAVSVPAGLQRCQVETVPAEAKRLRVFAGVEGRGGPLRVSIRSPKGGVREGRSGPFRGEDTLEIPLTRKTTQELRDATVCLLNEGSTTIQVAGNRTPASVALNPAGDPTNDDARIDYFAAERSSRLGLAGRVAERLPLLKAGFLGSWTVWALLALLCAAWALTLNALMNSLRS